MKIHPITGKEPGVVPSPPTARNTWNPDHGRFGWTRTDSSGSAREHKGIDFAVPCGTPVYAAHDGIVDGSFGLEQGGGNGYGRRLYINGDGVTTLYAHLSAVFVRPDEVVRAGWCVGLTGCTGNLGFNNKTPDHLHFGVKVNGKWTDPEYWLRDNDDG